MPFANTLDIETRWLPFQSPNLSNLKIPQVDKPLHKAMVLMHIFLCYVGQNLWNSMNLKSWNSINTLEIELKPFPNTWWNTLNYKKILKRGDCHFQVQTNQTPKFHKLINNYTKLWFTGTKFLRYLKLKFLDSFELKVLKFNKR